MGADGAQSQIRDVSGLRSSGFAYQQRAVVATVRVEDPDHHTAWQRFLPTGAPQWKEETCCYLTANKRSKWMYI